jgi:hypothetical protein
LIHLARMRTSAVPQNTKNDIYEQVKSDTA